METRKIETFNGQIILNSNFFSKKYVSGALRTTGERIKPLTHIFGMLGKPYGIKAIPKECHEGNFNF